MIVCEAANHSLRERLLRDADRTLAKAKNAGHAAVEIKRHAKELAKHQQSVEVHEVHHQQESNSNKHLATGSLLSENVIQKCKSCSGSRPRGRCPAYGKRCRECNRRNHFVAFYSSNGINHVTYGALPLQYPAMQKIKTIFH